MNQIIKKKQLLTDASPAKKQGEARIELLKDGDVVRAIEVRCACGGTTVLELDYTETHDSATDS